jgi:hypothetical protein
MSLKRLPDIDIMSRQPSINLNHILASIATVSQSPKARKPNQTSGKQVQAAYVVSSLQLKEKGSVLNIFNSSQTLKMAEDKQLDKQ